jgi:hypothetical protein
MYEQLWRIVLTYVVVPDKVLVDWVDLKELNVDDIPTGPEFDRLKFQRIKIRDDRFDDAFIFDYMCSRIIGVFTQITPTRWQEYTALCNPRGLEDTLAENASKFALDMIRRSPRLLDNGNIFRNPHIEMFMSRENVLEKCCNDVASMFHLHANPNPTIIAHCILHANGVTLSQYHMIQWCLKLRDVYWKCRMARKILSICMERPEPTPTIEIKHLEYFESDPDICRILDEPQFSAVSRNLAYDNPEEISKIEAEYMTNPEDNDIDWDLLCENPAACRPGGIIETELARNPEEDVIDLDWTKISRQPTAMNIITEYPDRVDFEGLVENPAAINIIKNQWPSHRDLQRYRIGLNPAIYVDDLTTIPRLAKLL